MIREPTVAGQFYESEKSRLLNEIKKSFLSEFGPGKLPEKRNNNKTISGIISPHAGYMFSGPCASYGFREIAESEFPDLFIILGLSHAGFFKSCFSGDDWETPLGIVKNDAEFCKLLANEKISNTPLVHNREHSIEVQLPFLQFISQDKELRFVPIIIGSDFEESVKGIRNAIKKYGKKVCIIASSDFSHIGHNYDYNPFQENKKENMYKLDRGAIDFILKMDSKGFLEYCRETGATICGRHPIAAIIELLKGKECGPELLKYYTSADILGDYGNAVGYASIVFR